MANQTEKSISLVLISFLSLFLELVFIRWLPSNVLSLAYFSNIVLISSFFGLGLGCLLASKVKDLFRWFPLILLAVVAIIISLRQFEVIIPPQDNEWIWSYYGGNKINSPQLKLGILAALSIVYILNASVFALIGQRIGLLMENFKPIKAYSLNLVGSILGIVVFGLFSFLNGYFNSPQAWFMIVGIISLWFLRKNIFLLFVGITCILIIITAVHFASVGEIWSPYYNIQVRSYEDKSFALFVNKFFHQKSINFESDPESADKYSLPYRLKSPKKVLILGAGTGNDVAIAKMHEVAQIDAVEIDPVIVELGRKLHPNRPYQNPNVRVFIDDARSFLKKNDDKYDMIILGTLDSLALLSGMSTVRLDNFVYTIESLESVKQHLNEKGIVVLMFSVAQPWLGEKLINMVSTVFDEPQPIAYLGTPNLFNLMIVGGPGLKEVKKSDFMEKSSFRQIPNNPGRQNLPTDDWPYLYLLDRKIPGHYLKAIAILLTISAIAIFVLSPKNIFNRSGLNFFCLGAAFLLLETKSVTTLSLLFGSTWLVNVFVFSSILIMILLANLLVSKIDIKRIWVIYACLGLALLFNYLLPTGYFLGEGFWIRSILSSFIIALPLFFAAIIFSFHFKSTNQIVSVYGINLMGAVLGGFLEYSSMATGFKSLYILAGALYLISFLSFTNLFPLGEKK